MPLNKKGKKIIKSMKDQYGSKRGEKVFYASMNKGNIRGVEKMKNGGLGKRFGPPPKKGPASQGVTLKSGIKVLKAFTGAQADTRAGQAMSPGTSSTGATRGGGRDPSAQFKDSKPVSAQARQDLATQRKTARETISPSTKTSTVGSTTSPKIAQSNFFSGFTDALDTGLGMPVTPAGLAITSLKAIENARRAKRAKGEYFTSSKKIMPANRDFYRQYGRKLDTKIGSLDEDYLKEAGISGFGIPKTPEEGNSTPRIVTCPDGSMPPCVDTTKTQSVTPGGRNAVTPYKFNFQYRDGGLVRGSGKVLKGRVKKARIY